MAIKKTLLEKAADLMFEAAILDGVAKKMDISEDKVIVTVDEHANTSAGSIPLALNHAVRSGRAKKGDLILSEAMGGGFSWGASLFRL